MKEINSITLEIISNGITSIAEQMDSTTIVLSNQKATVDEYLNMMIERK